MNGYVITRKHSRTANLHQVSSGICTTWGVFYTRFSLVCDFLQWFSQSTTSFTFRNYSTSLYFWSCSRLHLISQHSMLEDKCNNMHTNLMQTLHQPKNLNDCFCHKAYYRSSRLLTQTQHSNLQCNHSSKFFHHLF